MGRPKLCNYCLEVSSIGLSDEIAEQLASRQNPNLGAGFSIG